MDFDRIESYDYDLPGELIAAEPAVERPQSRLLAADPRTKEIRHLQFRALPELLDEGDLLVFNDAYVVGARLQATKPTGGVVELFVVDVLEPQGADRWSARPSRPCPKEANVGPLVRCMTKSSKRLRAGTKLTVEGGLEAEVVTCEPGFADVRLATELSVADLLERYGQIPLPPYIVKRRREMGLPEVSDADRERYQTVYARTPGAVAAPTAGLHFDETLLRELGERGVETAHLTLYVGPGTFRPVQVERLSDHVMHTEEYEVPRGLGPAITKAREGGRRVVAVGTTSVRTLEAEAARERPFEPGRRSTNLFIRPGFEFGAVDAMITNFHLPRSTLLALVYAFGGADFVRGLYEEAIRERYRFYSYGDSMFLRRRHG